MSVPTNFRNARGELAARVFIAALFDANPARIILPMNAALETRIRAAGAEMSKPGRWRVALDQLDQATSQILALPDLDVHAAELALEYLQQLYQWAGVMQNYEYHRLNQAVMRLTEALADNSFT